MTSESSKMKKKAFSFSMSQRTRRKTATTSTTLNRSIQREPLHAIEENKHDAMGLNKAIGPSSCSESTSSSVKNQDMRKRRIIQNYQV